MAPTEHRVTCAGCGRWAEAPDPRLDLAQYVPYAWLVTRRHYNDADTLDRCTATLLACTPACLREALRRLETDPNAGMCVAPAPPPPWPDQRRTALMHALADLSAAMAPDECCVRIDE